jgi:cytochrome c oxidase cbb3-type subunit 3
MTAEPRKPAPAKGEDDRLLEHNYDGIQEYDNPLPGWWTLILWATVAYSALYALNLPGIGIGKGRIANYEADMARAHAQQEALAAKTPAAKAWDDPSLWAMTHDPARVAAGRQTFTTNCVPCHRADGGGVIGPNLTDDYWIHGARPTELLKVVREGVPDKGMPTWSQILKPDEIVSVVVYVLTLHDTHPAAPKEPQGTKVEIERD